VSSFGLELASKLKVPHIQHIREYLAEDYSIAICAEDHFRSRNLEAKTLFVALSNDLRETYVERGLVSSRFIRVINNPLQDLTGSAKRGTYRTIGEELRVCLPGRIFPGKNQLEAVLAIGHIKKLRPSLRVTLVLYGDADEDYKSKLLAAATSLGVGDQLVFAGFSDRLLDDLKEFHVGLACSRREVFARTVIEMMSLGLPVIAPQSGGFVEQLEDGCTGLLYSPGDATELAQKMLTLADDLELRRTLGGNARESATNRFSPEKFAQLMSDVYEEALSL
jgi:glycosyltransferase involved in cell wall biosynthesis